MSGSSALMAIGHIFLFYILFLSFIEPFGHGAGAPLVKTKSHATPFLCSGPEKGLRVVHKYGPCSPFGLNKTAATSSQILIQDERRVRLVYRSHQKRRGVGKGKGKDARETHPLNNALGAGNFLVQVGFGTPVQTFHLTLDTGSFVTWVRCQPPTSRCPQRQQPLLFYPSCSTTSSNASCWPSCKYEQWYKDHSNAAGNFLVDTLRIEDDVKVEYEIPEFVFLCALTDNGDFGKASGILGLGLGSSSYKFGSYSLVSQTATMFDKVFCHCLPTLENSKGYVYFGEKARENCPFSGSYTPLLRKPSAGSTSFYYVNLTAITINQKRVPISSGVSSPGTILDSGTVITRLPSSVYSVLRSEFQGWMTDYPRAPPDELLDTCYNLEGYANPEIPKMVLHFENLDVNLDQTAITWNAKGKSKVCWAFAANEDGLTIIGNHQQQKLNILYNIPDQRVEIGPGKC
ncbi:hypothetical protein GQ457_07G037280 [Hibiscus cannabinus]